MSRALILTLALVSVVLVALPVSQPKPGLPATLKADEPAYLLAALSMARDGDLVCDLGDLERLFDEYPYLTPKNLILATTDGWKTLGFGKPYLYSFFALPWVAIWGSNGMVAFNLVLVALVLWLGTLHLRRYNSALVAGLFAIGFVLWSTMIPYAFWLHPEVFMMAAAAACLYLGLDVAAAGDSAAGRWRDLAAPMLSGACLALGAYHKPVLAVLGLAVLVALAQKRRWRSAMLWIGGAAIAGLLVVGGSYVLTGYPTPYLGVERAGFHIENPYELPVVPETLAADEADVLEQRSAGWGWIFRIPEIEPTELRENLVAFLVGRHTGLLIYQPFAVVALILFLLHGRRSAARWTLLASLAVLALFFLLLIPFNWHGGGGFIGNRYFVIAYPAFLFLITRIRPASLALVGWIIGPLFLGSLALSPMGAIVPQPTLQAHARASTLRAFPFELGLKEVPGHHGIVIGDVWFTGRKDQMRPIESELWLQGADTVELWAQSARELHTWVFSLRTGVPSNTVTIRLGDASARVDLVRGESQTVILTPSRPDRRRTRWDPTSEQRRDIFAYRVEIETATGELPKWRLDKPHNFYLGTVLTYRGADPPTTP